MTPIEEHPPETPAEAWELELKQVGFVRRIFNARRWYGADWWFVAISTLMVLVFIFVAFFPNLLSPYSPDDLVGPRFLAPGAHPALTVLIVPSDSPVNTLKDLAVAEGAPRPAVSVV
ncbi:MAG TPA: hypothetical protein VMR98_01575, partial [Candidatus Polarisedimenticolaceae bacterium]|nr:hypothetical protein [Candidatus Polarisedimenticolaceae bacterium]